MSKILTKFYLMENRVKYGWKNLEEMSLVEYVVGNKLVNKLYSFIIRYKQYREESIGWKEISGGKKGSKGEISEEEGSEEDLEVEEISSVTSRDSE